MITLRNERDGGPGILSKGCLMNALRRMHQRRYEKGYAAAWDVRRNQALNGECNCPIWLVIANLLFTLSTPDPSDVPGFP